MAIYKGYEIDDVLYSIIRHMPQIEQYRNDLERQQVLWDYLSVMAQLENLENDLGSASQQFNFLTGVLLNRLGLETINKVVNEYAFKAQVAINILVRNLFERTADIGFLATDGDICQFLLNNQGKRKSDIPQEAINKLRLRFDEYVQKYSVYHDVVLLDPHGHLLARLNDYPIVDHSQDWLVQEAITTEATFVEKFGYSDLVPESPQSLIYAFRVESDEQKPLGVVCLCFKFEDEITGIFGGLVNNSIEILLLVDSEHRVVATSREDLTPIGTKIQLDPTKLFTLASSKGREYLACARLAETYQGYTGPGWLSCALLDLDQIFKSDPYGDENQFKDKKTLDSVMQGNLFDTATKSIPILASQIENELNRSVWNGNARQASERNGSDAVVSRVLLDEIKSNGEKNKTIFEKAIFDIQKTVISETLRLSQSSAKLAIDIMDRNLYERANDCRWWALDSTLRAILNQPILTIEDSKKITSTLQYINDLYTVYTNLILFDRQGKVLAVSNVATQSLIGTTLESGWVKSLLLHQKSSQYVVSEFEKTTLYNNEATYIYGAAIRSPDDQKVVGGIGIVFDAKPQFTKILEDVLSNEKLDNFENRSFAVFVDCQHRIIASSNPNFDTGETFEIGASLKSEIGDIQKGNLIQYDGNYYAAAYAKSLGYREYKGENDPYQNEVFAYVFFDIGAVQEVSDTKFERKSTPEVLISTGGYKTQVSSFYVGDDWLGIQSDCVECAVKVDKLIPIHGNSMPEIVGYILYKSHSVLLLNSSALFANKSANASISEAVIIKIKNRFVAISIDLLGDTLDVDQDTIQPLEENVLVSRKLVKNIVTIQNQGAHKKMLQLLDLELIASELNSFVEMSV